MLDLTFFILGCLLVITLLYLIIGVSLTIYYRREIKNCLDENPELFDSLTEAYLAVIILWPWTDWKDAKEWR